MGDKENMDVDFRAISRGIGLYSMRAQNIGVKR